MIITRNVRETLTAVELFHGDILNFTKCDGDIFSMEVLDTGAEIMQTNLELPLREDPKGRSTLRFWADLNINGQPHRYEREIGTNKSFYEPLTINGVNLWLDAVDAVFDFLLETHGPCRPNATASNPRNLPPRHHARFAIQDATLRICPELLHPWCPLPPGGITIDMCYTGEDCWMGAYFGASAHGGLDLNHPRGTPLFAPIDIDEQFLIDAVANGFNNNRWHGLRHWNDHSTWVLRSAHMVRLLVPEHTSVKAGTHYAEGAGVWVGKAEHSHFSFAILDHGNLIRLDPWILFWQMYRDHG